MAAVCLLCAAGQASAQNVPYDPAVDVQLFEYAVGPKSFLTVTDADVQAPGAFNVDMLVTFLTDPFTIYNTDATGSGLEGTRTEVVQSVLAGEVSGAYGVMDKLQVGVSLPLIFSMSGQGLDPNTAMAGSDGLQISGIGDLRAEAKYHVYDSGPFALAATGGLTLPSSFGAGGNEFIGDDLPTVRAHLAAQWTNADGKLTFGANTGVIFRKPRTIYSSKVGQQLTYGAAGAFHINDRVTVIGEVFGRSALTALDLSASPLEGVGGLRVKATRTLSVLAGGGAGLVQGIGSPGVRAFVSVGWAPDFRDSDHDGIRNDKDKCPIEAEDIDGFEDSDGCPDLDNDNDKRLDSEDKCPNEKEDIDGFEDEDGCPEKDNDKDGIDDVDDRCPNDAEDGLQPYPHDGCPGTKRDSDDDGVMDADDKCPDDVEDQDGFEDWDGCPDPDNDGDGVLDDDDKCPVCSAAAGDADGDGCPDLAPPVDERIAHMDGDRVVLGASITFDRHDKLTSPGSKLAASAGALMLGQREVAKWAIVVAVAKGHSERRAQIHADRRADAIKEALARVGVKEDSYELLAAVADRDTVRIVAREHTDAKDEEFVCPAGAEAVPRQKPAAATTAPAAAPDSNGGAAPSGGNSEGMANDLGGGAPARAAPPVPDAFNAFTGVVQVQFKRSTAQLASGQKVLDDLAALLVANPQVSVDVGAHTDNHEGPDKSKEITQAQADFIGKYLTGKGVDASRIKAVGYGMDEPRASNKTHRGRKENRRVELKFH